jgi:hypothetical protein
MVAVGGLKMSKRGNRDYGHGDGDGDPTKQTPRRHTTLDNREILEMLKTAS